MELGVKVNVEEDISKNIEFKFKQRLRVTYKDLKKFLNAYGYYEHRQKCSTHIIYKHKQTGKTIPIPYSHGTICQGTVSKILKQMDVTRNELAFYLYS